GAWSARDRDREPLRVAGAVIERTEPGAVIGNPEGARGCEADSPGIHELLVDIERRYRAIGDQRGLRAGAKLRIATGQSLCTGTGQGRRRREEQRRSRTTPARKELPILEGLDEQSTRPASGEAPCR